MKKNSKNIKRLALMGMYGILVTSTITGCTKEQKEVSNHINVEEDNTVKYCIENANGEIQSYDRVIKVAYEYFEQLKVNAPKEKNCLLMALESEDDNQRVYRSFSIPEISLIESFDKENFTLKYELHCDNQLKEDNEEFTKSCPVIYAHNVIFINYENLLSYQDILDIEKNITKQENLNSEKAVISLISVNNTFGEQEKPNVLIRTLSK